MREESGSIEDRRLRAALSRRMFGSTTPLPKIGRFEVSATLGQGGMGVVFRALDPLLDRDIALKVVRAQDAVGSDSGFEIAQGRILREAKVLARLQHAHVVTIHEVGVHEGEVFVAMELLGGGDLRRWAEQHRERTSTRTRQALNLLIEAGHGLAAAHAAGIVHRDFKPSNVMLGRDGRARVGDFGLARAAASDGEDLASRGTTSTSSGGDSASLTSPGVQLGTRGYMPPEQARGEVITVASDQYAFCVSAVEVLTGTRPKSAQDVPQHVRGTPRRLWTALRRGMEPEPHARWPSLDLLLATLEQTRRRRWPQWTLAAALSLGVIAVARSEEPTSSQPSCDGGATRVEQVWSQSRRRALREVVAGTGIAAAPELAAQAEATLEPWLDEWSTALDETCRLHHHAGELPDAQHASRVRCLDNQLRRANGLIEAVASSPAVAVGTFASAVRELPDISRCSAPIDPRHDAFIPADPERAADYERLLDEVARRRAQRDIGEWELAHRGALRLAQRAAAHPNTPVLAEATFAEGLALAYEGSPADGARRLQLAARMAAAVQDPELEALAWTEYASMIGRTVDKYDVAQLAYANAAIAIERIPDGRRARARLLRAEGSALYQRQGDFEGGAAKLEQVVAIVEELDGAQSPTLVPNLLQLANAQSRGRKQDIAHGTLERALSIASALGPEHPMQVDLHDILAANYARDESFDLALEHAREASRISIATSPANGKEPAIMRNNEAVALLEAGKVRDALEVADDSLDRLRNAFGSEHYQVGGAGHRVRAAVLLKLGRLEEALSSADTDQRLCRKGLGNDHFWVATALEQRADIHRARADWEHALADHREVLRIEQVNNKVPHARLGRAWRDIAADLQELGRDDEAEEALEAAAASGTVPKTPARVERED